MLLTVGLILCLFCIESRKDKYNPYTLYTKAGRYYISFVDVNNNFQKIEVSQEVFESFNRFELEDISQMNEYDRHLEHSEVYEHTLYQKNVSSEQPLEEYFDKAQDSENLHMAINKLPNVQKRRLKSTILKRKPLKKYLMKKDVHINAFKDRYIVQ